ncbi:DUF4440 domain-containing protein [Nostocoides sp. F2B08]|uniref:nuclear transport factor 2 family protein n=1 Tax=Nostocoides sp. F2B08 TaxID=2653936 RepID=UPI0012636079|nr:nuclear transport factor 2 family protein [Tetrasphaera sp. F2B08]KAB7745971.1 DUF4440 domain-containing protein [Tetrasphaera sp. F2B08]
MVTTAETVLEENASLLASGDAAGLAARYAPDARLVHAGGTARGRIEIESLFAEQIRTRPRVESLETLGRSEDTVAYRARMRLDDTVVDVVGTIVLREGLIWRQTTVVVGESSRGDEAHVSAIDGAG